MRILSTNITCSKSYDKLFFSVDEMWLKNRRNGQLLVRNDEFYIPIEEVDEQYVKDYNVYIIKARVKHAGGLFYTYNNVIEISLQEDNIVNFYRIKQGALAFLHELHNLAEILLRKTTKRQKNIMADDLEGIRFAKSIDFSKVHGSDRVYVRDILVRVLNFHNPMPKLNVDIYDAGDHYNIALKGWNSEINDEAWYDNFLDKQNRETTFDRILSTGTIPTTDDGVSVKIIRVSKSTFSKKKRNK